MKKTLFVIIGAVVIYVAYLYLFGKRETYLIPLGYEGSLFIIANQKDGIELDKKNVVYDFTKSNVIKLKHDLITGFSPLGYLNYYEVEANGDRVKIDVKEESKENIKIKDDKIHVWSYYFEIGNCEHKGYEKIEYEAILIGTVSNIDSNLSQMQAYKNEAVCKLLEREKNKK